MQSVYLGRAKDNTTYVVEVATDAQGSTLYVYEKGAARASGFSDRRQYGDWGFSRTAIELQASPKVTASSVVSLDNLSELTSLELEPSLRDRNQVLPTQPEYITSYLYDGMGRQIASVDALGKKTLTQYDDSNRRTVTTLANGLVQTRVYDSIGALISSLDADNSGALGTWRYLYDGAGRLGMVEDAVGARTFHFYDLAGRKVGTLNGEGALVEYTYDASDRLVSTRAYAALVSAGQRAGLLDANGRLTGLSINALRPQPSNTDRRQWTLYDAAGRAVKTVDAAGAVIENLYDGSSRLIKRIAYANRVDIGALSTSTQAQDATVTPVYSANDRISRTFYDDSDRVRGTLDGEGYLVEFRYDAAGQLLQTRRYANPTLAALRVTGNLDSLIPTLSADDTVTHNFYNGKGERVAEVDAEGYYTEYVYDAAGNLTQRLRSATKVDANALIARPVMVTVSAKTSGIPVSARVRVDGVEIKGSPVTVGSTSFADYTFSVELVAAHNHSVDVVLAGPGSELAVQSISVDGQTVPFDSAQLILGMAWAIQGGLVPPSKTLRFAVYGQARVRPSASARDQTLRYSYNALNQLTREVDVDGTVTEYRYDAAGNQVSKSRAQGEAEVRTLTRRYDRQGRLLAELSGNGSARLSGLVSQEEIDAVWQTYAIKHRYDAGGRRIATSDASGNTTWFYYNNNAQLIYSVNALGEVYENRYDALGQLSESLKHRFRLSASALASLTGGVANDTLRTLIITLAQAAAASREQLGYDAAGRLVTRVNALGAVSSFEYNSFGEEVSRTTPIDGTNSLVQTTELDRRGLVTRRAIDPAALNLRHLMGYDAFGRVVQDTDAANNVTYTDYDRLGRVLLTRDALNQTRSTAYDAFNRVLTVTDALNSVTAYVYDDQTRSVRITTAEGITRASTRNRHGETASETDGKGGRTLYLYDRDGNLEITTTPAGSTSAIYDANDRLLESVDQRGIKTRYEYDTVGRLIGKTLDPNGLNITTRYRYDALGRAVWTRNPNGVWTRTTYDAQGQITAVVLDPRRGPDWTQGADDNPNGIALRTEYSYDEAGRTVTLTEAAGTQANRTTTYLFDKAGRRTQETIDPSGLSLRTQYTYDGNNNVTSKADPAGNLTRYFNDAEDRLIYTLDALNQLSERRYDAEGRVIQVVAYAKSLAGLPSSATRADIQAAVVSSASDQSQRNVYDRDGRLIYVIDALGYVVGRTYDSNDKITRETQYAVPVALDGNPTVDQVRGALRTSDADRSVQYVYDAANRQRYKIGVLGFVSESRYDAAGNVLETIEREQPLAPNASLALSDLDALYLGPGNASRDRVQRMEYDAAGRLARRYDAEGYGETFGYDAAGNKISFTNKKGFVWTYAYDANRRLLSETTPPVRVTRVRAQNTTLMSEASDVVTTPLTTRMTYDERGNVLTRTEAVGLPEARITTYSYDKANRQVGIRLPAVGVYNSAQGVLATNGLNGGIARTETTETPTTAVVFDALGQAVVNRDAGGNFSYKIYDAQGRVIYEVDAEYHVTRHDFDRFGNKVRITRYSSAIAYSGGLTPLTKAHIETQLAQQTTAQAAANRTLDTVYDKLNRAVQIVEPTVFTYDSTTGQSANTARTTTNLYNSFGEVIKQTKGTASTYYYFDQRGLNRFIVDALGYVTSLDYDSAGNLARRVEYAAALSGTWNENAAPSPTVTTLTSAPGATTGYDRVSAYSYDRLNRKLTETRVGVQFSAPNGTGTEIVAKQGDVTARYDYDALGNVVRVTDGLGATTYTYFDALGRIVASADPTREVTGGGAPLALAPVRVLQSEILSFAKLSEESYSQVSSGGGYGPSYGWVGANAVRINWTSLEEHGPGRVRVVLDYLSQGRGDSVERSFAANASVAGVTVAWNGTTVRGLSSVSRVRVWKEIDGQETMLFDSAQPSSAKRLLSFQRPAAGFSAALRYRVAGGSQWTSLTTTTVALLQLGDVSSLPAGQYDYDMTLTRNATGEVLAIGTGSFQLTVPDASGSTNVASFVDRRDLKINVIGAKYESQPGNEAGSYNQVLVSPTTAQFSWSLEGWQGGDVKVIVDYHSAWIGSQQWSGTYSWHTVKQGITYSASGDVPLTVQRVRVLRVTGGSETTIIDRSGSGADAERLILQGKVAGISGILVDGETAIRAAVHLGGGVYAVDLYGLARGEYRYKLVGATIGEGRFEVKYSTAAGRPLLQEKTFAGVRKLATYINSQDPNLFVTVSYRRVGEFASDLQKVMQRSEAGSNEWVADYDDVPAGLYDYRLILTSASGPVSYDGRIAVARGANLTAAVTQQSLTQTVTPLTVAGVSAFGQTVKTLCYARGAASTDLSGYTILGSDAADQTTLFMRDGHGQVIQTQAADGSSTFASFDVLGHTAKEWTPYVDNDNRVQHAVKVFTYDRMGSQVSTKELVVAPNGNLAPSVGTRALETVSLTATVTDTVRRWISGYDEQRNPIYAEAGSNVTSISWSDLSAWGDGDVRLTVVSNIGTEVRTVTDATASVTINWTARWTGISISRVVVEKQDLLGYWVTVHDRVNANGPYGQVLAFTTGTLTDEVRVSYRALGTTEWKNGTAARFGKRDIFDLRSLSTGSYEYDIALTRVGEGNPYSYLRGVVNVNGVSGSLGQGTGASNYSASSLPLDAWADRQARYNAFGEITAKGINGRWQESFEYDIAGRLWRTNQKDGLAKVILYDRNGNATAELKSLGTDLNSVSDPASALALTNQSNPNAPATPLTWTRTQYDALGRAVNKIAPSFNVTTSDQIGARVRRQLQMSYTTSMAGGSSAVTANWSDMSAWGTGQVQVVVDIRYQTYSESKNENVITTTWSNPVQTSVSALFSSSAGATSGTVNLGLPWNSSFTVLRVQVQKQDASGIFRTIFDRAPGVTPPSGWVMLWNAPPPGSSIAVTAQVSDVTKQPRTFINFGATVLMDVAGLSGPCNYEIVHTLPLGATQFGRGTLIVSPSALGGSDDPPSTALMVPTQSETLDRWGNVLKLTDERGSSTVYTYNDQNKALSQAQNTTDVWSDYYILSRLSPTTQIYLDALGRQIGVRDANGSLNLQIYDAGGNVVREAHADQGQIIHTFNALGRRIRSVDALGKITSYSYDQRDRLIGTQRPIGQESIAYDALGNRTRQTNALGHSTLNWYDPLGRVIQTRQPLGQETVYYYDAQGKKRKEIDGNGRKATWTYDYFGRILQHNDFGGGGYSYLYDSVSKRLLAQSNGWGQNLSFSYYEDGRLKVLSDLALGANTLYEYDAAGNRTRERYEKGGIVYRDTRIVFDELNRMSRVFDQRDSILYSYDANGNRRRIFTQYYDSNNTLRQVDNYYLYDSMNRIVLSQGVLTGGRIQIRPQQDPNTLAQGIEIAYDRMGNRLQTRFHEGSTGTTVIESYKYDDNHRLTDTLRAGRSTGARRYDALGRVTEVLSYDSANPTPNVIKERRLTTFDANNRVIRIDVRDKDNIATQQVRYTEYDALGNTLAYETEAYASAPYIGYTNYFRYRYDVRESYKEAKIEGRSTHFLKGDTTTTYDVNANIVSVVDRFRSAANRDFLTDLSGKILRKTEDGKTEWFFYANDNPVGSSGIVNSTGGLITRPDFDYNYTPVNDKFPATSPGTYVVSKGDTLRGIAFAVWGDATLWFLLAEANGLDASSALEDGQTLTIPNRITNLRNSYDVFKPYRPGEIIGDTTPKLPDPPPPPSKRGGCGGLGTILVIIVAVVVAIVVPYLLPEMPQLLAFLITGAASNLAAQITANLVGLQDGIDWKGVAIGAVTSAITMGIPAGASIPAQIASAVLRNMLTQGVNIIAGQQEEFNWKSLAIAAISAPIANAIGKELGNTVLKDAQPFVRDFFTGLATGAVRETISIGVHGGGRFDWVSVVGDAFGNAVGNSIAGSITERRRKDERYGLTSPGEAKGLKLTPEALEAFDRQVDERLTGGARDYNRSSRPTEGSDTYSSVTLYIDSRMRNMRLARSQYDSFSSVISDASPFMDVPGNIESFAPPPQVNPLESINNLLDIAERELAGARRLRSAAGGLDFKTGDKIFALIKLTETLRSVQGLTLEQIEARAYAQVSLSHFADSNPELTDPSSFFIRTSTRDAFDTKATPNDEENSTGPLAWASKPGFNIHKAIDIAATGDRTAGLFNRAHQALDSIQNDEFQFMHSLRTSVGDDSTSERFARAMANLWVRDNIAAAAQAYSFGGAYREIGGLYQGFARHTLQDSTSPEHRDYRDGSMKIWKSLPWLLNDAKLGVHGSQEMFFPGQNSFAVSATLWIHNTIYTRSSVPAGDLITRFGVDRFDQREQLRQSPVPANR